MGCKAIMHSWSLCGLVGAFLDLVITYFLLCISTFAFFLSTFLSFFFGLNLPCTCTITNPDHCFQKTLLVDCPSDRLSRVKFSIRSKSPFCSVLGRNEVSGAQPNSKLLLPDTQKKKKKLDDGGRVEQRGYSNTDVSRRSPSPSSASRNDPVHSNEVPIGAKDLKGKSVLVVTQRQRIALRRRRRGNHRSLAHDGFASSSSFDHVHPDVQYVPGSPSSIHSMVHEVTTYDSTPIASNDGHQTSMMIEKATPHICESNDVIEANDSMDKNSLSSEDQRSNVESGLGFNVQHGNAVKILEQTLKEVQAARASLWSELEKERIAAATAADEAMAMILRLQEEKAAMQMEARQYQRILEEKSTYDDEEKGILKEIIVRREREKHFLEKQVEAYRNLILDCEGLGDDLHADVDSQWRFVDFSDDPIEMLQQISNAVEKARNVQREDDLQITVSASLEKDKCTTPLEGDDSSVVLTELDDKFIDDRELVHDSNEHTQLIQEKGMVSMDKFQTSQQSKLQIAEAGSNMQGSVDHTSKDDKNSTVLVWEKSHIHGDHSSRNVALRTVQRNDGAEGSLLDDNGMKIKFDADVNIYDVHVIDDKQDAHDYEQTVIGGLSSSLMHDQTANITRKCAIPSESTIAGTVGDSSSSGDILGDVETQITRNTSAMPKLLAPPSTSHSGALHSEMRRHSVSAVDLERFRLNTEVGWLQERLRAVQERCGKLNFSTEYRESDDAELQLLEGILNQLQEIRELREPRNTVRQASLPPPSSKALSKKRRSRSVSLDVYKRV